MARNTRKKLIDAAQRLIDEHGAANLTLDAVAAAADTSKGGLIYHFASKEELLTTVAGETVEVWKSDIAEHTGDGPPLVGYVVNAGRPDPSRHDLALALAWAYDPGLIEPWREYSRELAAADRAEPDPALAAIVRLAADGLWLATLGGLYDIDDATRAILITRLTELARRAIGDADRDDRPEEPAR